MFGRKRKKDEEGVGLAGLGTGGVTSSVSATPNVSVTANPVTASTSSPAPTPPAAAGGSPPNAESPFDAISGLTPGTMPTNPAAMLGQILSGQGPVGELVAEIRANPEAFRQRMLTQAQAAGVSPIVMSPQAGTPAVGGTAPSAPQPQQVDVIDELTKAADLHHQGVLTDAEFEAYKKKLLGG